MRLRVARKVAGNWASSGYKLNTWKTAKRIARRRPRQRAAPVRIWASRSFAVALSVTPEVAKATIAAMKRTRRRLRRLPAKERTR